MSKIKDKVIELLEDFHKIHFDNVECDTCLSGNEDFFDLIETIKNMECSDNGKSHITNDAYPHTFAYGGKPLMKVKPCKE